MSAGPEPGWSAPALLRWLRPWLRGQGALLGGSMLALVAATLLRLLEPWPLALVIDHVLAGHVPAAARGLGAYLAAWDGAQVLALCALAVVLVAGLQAGARYLATLGFALAGNRVLGRVRTALHAHLLRLPLSFHQRARTGDLTLRLTSDIAMLKEASVSALLPLATNVLVMLGMWAVMLALDWRLALAAGLPLPLLWFWSRRRGQRIYEASRQQRRREGVLAAQAAEGMAGIRTVQALGAEAAMERAFGGAEQRSARQDLRSRRLSAGLERGVDLLVALGTALVLWLGARRVLDGLLSPGDLLVFLSYLKSSFRPVREYAKYASRLAKARAGAERIAGLLARPSELADAPGARQAPPLSGALRFEGVQFGHDPARPVLRGLELALRAGEHVAVVGASGAGKSTLAGLLLRLHDPQQGCVRVDGIDLRQLRLDSLRRQIALLPQETLLFAASVRDNLTLGLEPPPPEQAVQDAARLAQAHDFIAALPQGYDTLLAERGASLSGGQRQRLAIARAALRQCPIVVLDEPTTGLDRKQARALHGALSRLLEGRTGLVITHDLELAARADRIVVLEHGRVAASGSHAELLAQGGSYAEGWRAAEREGEGLRHAA